MPPKQLGKGLLRYDFTLSFIKSSCNVLEWGLTMALIVDSCTAEAEGRNKQGC